MKLSDSPYFRKGKISGFSDDMIASKLIEMGLLPGSIVEVLRSAPLGCPLYIKVGNYRLALRKKEAEKVLVS
ncbi:MAG: hypothetical protein OHK0036_18390 [Bacteroidia bacterium]